MPMAASPTRQANASGMLICELATSRRLPSPSFEPMNSPMTAPITASVIATFEPEMTKGQRGGEPDFPEGLERARPHRRGQIEEFRRRIAQPRRGVDHDREER